MLRRTIFAGLAVLVLSGCGGGGGGSRTNPDLASLTVDAGILNPAFAAAITDYRVDVRWSIASVRITATAASDRSRITIAGLAVSSGVPSPPIDLLVGDNPIDVVATADNGTRKTYRLTVIRDIPAANANLDALSASVAPLDQIFASGLTSYDVTAGHLGASSRIKAVTSDPFASLTIDGAAALSGVPGDILPLAVGSSSFGVSVTAEDGRTRKTYTVTISRDTFATLDQRAYVKATNTDPQDQFGSSLAVFDDRLLAGAPFEQSGATTVDGDQEKDDRDQAGAAYLYERLGGIWTSAHYLKPANADEGDLFGWSVAAAESSLMVGAPGEQSLSDDPDDNRGRQVGAIYVFDAGGNTPQQTAYLKASNADDDDRFGSALAAGGSLLVVGAEFEQSNATGVDGDQTSNALTGAGAAYAFEKTGADWTQIAYLKPSNTRDAMRFGNAVAVSGSAIAVAASGENSGATGVNGDQQNTDSPAAGAAYLFARLADGSWTQTAYLKASNTQADDAFGTALALDGDTLAVGAPGEDSASAVDQSNNALPDAGAVYVFVRNGADQWVQQAYLKPALPGLRDRFGESVQLVGNLLAVGAPGERSAATGINGNDADESAVNSGAVYLFERGIDGSWRQIAYLKPSNTEANDEFGRALSLEGDTLAVGAPQEASRSRDVNGSQNNNDFPSAGAVYMFR